LNEWLSDLEGNQQLLMESLSMQLCSIAPAPNSLCTDAHQRNMMAMMVSLQRRLQTNSDEDRERQFFTHTLQCMTAASGHHVEIEEWMVTSMEGSSSDMKLGPVVCMFSSIPVAVVYTH
jgi:hypothetical protein